MNIKSFITKIKIFVLQLQLKIVYNCKTIEKRTFYKILFGFVHADFSPKKCVKCGHKKFKEVVTDRIEGVGACEYEIYCSKCKSLNGVWAYGSFDPN